MPDDPEHALWELIDDGSSDDPEEWPVYCPYCLYAPEDLQRIQEAVEKTELNDEEKQALAGKFYEYMTRAEGQN